MYFRFIDPVIKNFVNNPDSRDYAKVCRECDRIWWTYEGEMIKNAISDFKEYPEILEKRLNVIRFSKYVHTLFNNSAIVIGLLYGDGDFMQTVRISTECGCDTDCNAGNAGAILGAYLGQNIIPSYAKRFIRGEIIPGLKDWKDKSLFNLSKRTFTQAMRFESLKK